MPKIIKSPTTIESVGNKPKIIKEFIGLVTQTEKKKSPELRIPIANARRVADGLAFLLVELQDQ